MDGVKLTGVWRHKDKNGNTYLSGALSGISQLVILPNAYKRNDKDPDYLVYINESKKKGEAQSHMPKNDDL